MGFECFIETAARASRGASDWVWICSASEGIDERINFLVSARIPCDDRGWFQKAADLGNPDAQKRLNTWSTISSGAPSDEVAGSSSLQQHNSIVQSSGARAQDIGSQSGDGTACGIAIAPPQPQIRAWSRVGRPFCVEGDHLLIWMPTCWLIVTVAV